MQSAAIVGGGIAGLAVGLFAQKRGFDLPLFEKDTHLSCDDNLLWMAPNGLHLLHELGVMGSVLEAGVAQDAMHFATRGFNPVMSVRGDGLRQSCGYPIVAIRRGVLYGILRDRFVAQGGTLHGGKTAADVRLRDGGVDPRFDGETGWHGFDQIFAADGIGSTVRRLVFPKAYVHFQGLCTYLGRSRTPVASNYVGKTIEAWGKASRFVLTSLDGELVYFSAIERPSVYEKNSAPLSLDLVPRLRNLFATYHPDVTAVLDGVISSSLHRCNFGVVKGLPTYAVPSVCLLGDAAHGMPPNMGQGASLALEDAFVAVDAFAKRMSPSAFARHYDAARRPRASQMEAMATAMNTLFQPKSTLACWLRDAAARAMPDALSQRRAETLYRLPFALPSLASSSS